MASPTYQRICDTCSGTLKKNGTTTAGTTRYRCTRCGASTSAKRTGRKHQAEITRFVAWLLGNSTEAERGITRRQRDAMAWCWNVPVPHPHHNGVIHDAIMIDDTYFATWCLLVAYNGSHVIAWQWAERENTAAYRALLDKLVTPRVTITDGHRGSYAAITHTWPHVPVQRCFFHIHKRVTTLLTRAPGTAEGLVDVWVASRLRGEEGC